MIQGSKLSGLLYNVYTNEVPLVHKLMKDQEIMENILKEATYTENNTDHETVNFVDDSNSVISFENTDEINKYLSTFFKVLKLYYDTMKLKINSDKTNVLVVNKPKHEEEVKKIVLNTGSEVLVPKKQIKVLGFYLNSRLSMDSNLKT